MKQYKKYKVKSWGNLYFPTYDVHIDVVVFKNHSLLKKWVKKYKSCTECIPDGNFSGLMFPVDNNLSVVMFHESQFNIGTITHEVAHVRQILFNEVGMYQDGKQSMALHEAEAYFEGELVYQVYARVEKYIKKRPKLISTYKIER